jgi:hypothetical protein
VCGDYIKERRYLPDSRLNEGFCVSLNIEMREKNFTGLSLREYTSSWLSM